MVKKHPLTLLSLGRIKWRNDKAPTFRYFTLQSLLLRENWVNIFQRIGFSKTWQMKRWDKTVKTVFYPPELSQQEFCREKSVKWKCVTFKMKTWMKQKLIKVVFNRTSKKWNRFQKRNIQLSEQSIRNSHSYIRWDKTFIRRKSFTLQGIIWVLTSAQGYGETSPVHGLFYS